MHDFPLEELGPRAFEQLTVALALKALGPGVEAFGSGPDGGREATFEGTINWSATAVAEDDLWDGYTVIQAKQRESDSDEPHKNAAWLRKQIFDEFDRWMHPDSKRGRFPDNIVFVTNVTLSSVPGSGGIDTLKRLIDARLKENDPVTGTSLAKRGLTRWKIWHRDQLHGLLTANDGIRHAFPAMLTVGDFVARLTQVPQLAEHADGLHETLISHAKTTLDKERWVGFDEAGENNKYKPVDDVIIDLDAVGDDFRGTVLAGVFEHGDQILKRSIWGDSAPRHLVVTGKPGNGKSTISRFLTQAYRERFLRDETLSPRAAGVVAGTHDALRRLGLKGPGHRRWPLRVDLTDVADALGPSSDKSLLRWLSEKVSARSDADINPRLLGRWLKAWPSVIIFDGLDEVTVPEVRRNILGEIKALVEKADGGDADLLVIITTRPTGYTERLDPDNFGQLDLQELTLDDAVAYGKLVTEQRLMDDLDRRDLVLKRFTAHAEHPATARLMKTPLQVLIMTIILERMGALPADRYQLFWRYYDTVYVRELGKRGPTALLLSEHRTAITEIHERVGLALQQLAETTSDARALLPESELRRITADRFRELGFEDVVESERTVDQIVEAATQRLVLLVPGEDDSVTFEIRSLQELMAARALSNGTDEQVHRRLTATAMSPHWRNTWVFTAGRLFADGPDHRRDLVLDVITAVDQRPDWPSWLCPIGPELAAALLQDGLAAALPLWQRRLITVAVQGLTSGFPSDVYELADGLDNAATGNNAIRVRNAFKEASAGTPMAAARLVRIANHFAQRPASNVDLRAWATMNPAGKHRAKHMRKRSGALSAVRLSGSATIQATVALYFQLGLDLLELSDVVRAKVDAIMAELQLIGVGSSGVIYADADEVGKGFDAVKAHFCDPEVVEVFRLLGGGIEPELWRVPQALAWGVWFSLARRPVPGESLA